jgi:hypothetical protein
MKYEIQPNIRTPLDLGIAYLGNPHASIAPVSQKNRIDRAEYGRRLAEMEGGIFTPRGYIAPIKEKG